MKSKFRARAQWVKVLATKTDNMSFSLAVHMVGGENSLHRLSSDLHMHIVVHTHTHINKQIKKHLKVFLLAKGSLVNNVNT